MAGNYVGTNAAGSAALPNGIGIEIGHNATNNRIGTNGDGAGDVAERNVISGNTVHGIFAYSGAGANVVAGNFIGTNAAGTAAVGNQTGITIADSPDNRIGTNGDGTGDEAERNVISGNRGYGIIIERSGNVVAGNYIGVDATGTAMENGGGGIFINAPYTRIGGVKAGEGNIIAFSAADGVQLWPNAGPGNAILSNSIHSNGTTAQHLGIDLGADGPDANDTGDPDTGPNNLQNYPVLTSAVKDGGNLIIGGTLNSNANSTYRVEFFYNSSCDPSGHGEGRIFLGFQNVTTDGAGNADLNATFPVASRARESITATATDVTLYDHDNNPATPGIPPNNTSEFSACQPVYDPDDVPPIVSASPNPAATNEDTPVQITLTGVDTNNDLQTFQITQQPANGVITGQDAAPSCSTASGPRPSGTRTCTLTVTYTPNPNMNGPDSFKFTAYDGIAPPAEGTVNINVAANDDTDYVVNTTADADDGGCTALSTGNGCTLREAMLAANAVPGVQTIAFQIPAADAGCVSGVCTINLTGALPQITTSMTITGPGADLLTVQRSTGGNYRVFHVNVAAPNVVTFSGLSIKNGFAKGSGTDQGAGIYNQNSGTLNVTACTVSGNFAGVGAGIYNQGTLNVTASTVSGNGPTGIYNGGTLTLTNSIVSGNTSNVGGGLINVATAYVTNSTISGNYAGTAGGIINSGWLTLTNSTVSGNVATNADGGGIQNYNALLLTNSTVSGNSASGVGGGIYNVNQALTTLRSSIVALNTSGAGPNLSGYFATEGFNVIGTTAGGALTPLPTDQIGVTAAQLNLGPLADNGGPTQTHVLLPCSIAVDNGNSFSLTADQRGLPRPFDNPNVTPVVSGGDNSDVGAFESQDVPVVCTNPPSASASPNPATTVGDTPVQITLIGTDLNDRPLTFQITQQPAHGTLTGQDATPSCSTANGTRTCALTVTYTRNAEFAGPDSLKFAVSNGVRSPVEATVTVSVRAGEQGDYVVNTTADADDGGCTALSTGNGCTLREAMLAANAVPGVQTIVFQIPAADTGCVSGVCTISMGGALPAITESVSITGPGADVLTLRRGYPNVLRVVAPAPNVINISGLSIKNGGGSGVHGGGLANTSSGTVNITACTISGNSGDVGGGLANTDYRGTLNVTRSTISGNSAKYYGGGIANEEAGTLNVTNSTISGNSVGHDASGDEESSGQGGGILNLVRGHVNVTSSTIAGNFAGRAGGGVANVGLDDLGQQGTMALRNSIVAQNSSPIGRDMKGYIISNGYNIFSTGGATGQGDDPNSIFRPTPTDQLFGQLMLGPLASNGGHTQTHALLPGSIAIDKGDDGSASDTTDQRGFLRPVDDPSIPNAAGGDGTDVGAFEYGSFEYRPIVVTTAVDELDADSEPGSGSGTSLREAIRQANSLGAGSRIITFASNLAGQTLTLGSAWSNASDDESASALVINGANIFIQGPSTAPGITLNVAPGANLRHFFVSGTPNTGLTLSYLTLTGGKPQLPGSNNGGAVLAQGPLTVRNCTFTGNSSGEGGAIQSDGGAPSLLVENSTFSGNTSGGPGAAISAAANQITFRHLTVTNNTGGSAIALGGAATMVNTIVAGNGNDSFEMAPGGSLTAQTTNNICAAAAVPGLTSGSNNNLLGVPVSLLYFGLLASNGGPTQTHAIGANSLAINGGVAIAGLTTDQRGSARSVGGVPDIGAYEEPTGDADPDGDSLTNFQEWSLGSDPTSLDGDADGYNDATEMLAQTNPASAASIPPSTHVERVFGYGPARGLDLTGDFAYAFNVGTNGAVGQAGDANFTADNAPGITMSAPNQVNPWGAPNFGSAAADDVLENVYKSIRWANSADADPAKRRITVDLNGLTVGRRYKLQLLFGEACCNRNFDISVEGSLVADDFKPALAQGSLSLTKAGSAFVHEFVASDTTLNILLDATNVADPSLDRNPILNGVTLELLGTAAAPPSITPAGGSYAGNVQVSLGNNAPGTTLRYTTDGSTPTETHGAIYSGPFILTSSATVKAIAYGGGLQPSAVTSATYTVTPNAVAHLSISDVTKAEGNTGQTTFSFTVSLDAPAPAGGVTFNASTSDTTNPADAGSDYVALVNQPGTIAQGSASTTVNITVNGDTTLEPNETFLVNLSTPTNATISDGQGTGTILNDDGAPAAGQIIISEFRLRGPDPDGAGAETGELDEFIELYNTTDSDFIVVDSAPLPALAARGWAIVSDDPLNLDPTELTTPKFTIPVGTRIPAHGHYLVTNALGYSLSAYAAADVVPQEAGGGAASYNANIADGSGLALYRTGNPASFTPAERLDAVGFTGSTFFEGTALTPAGGINTPLQHSFARKLTSGLPQDTQDNEADFVFVEVSGAALNGRTAILGAPGPENSESPIQRNATTKASLIDPTQLSTAPPNRVRDLTPGGAGTPTEFGTLDIRRKFTNTTGQTVTALRFRIVDVTTLGTPNPGGAQADVRLLTSTDTTANGGTITIRGTTIQVPADNAFGGGLNATGVVALPGGTLASGASINVRFLLGVAASGGFRFLVNVEAVTSSSNSRPNPNKQGRQFAKGGGQ